MILRRIRLLSCSAGAAVASLALSSAAGATTLELGGGVGADFNAGADTLLELEFDDGSDQEIKAGNGLSLFVAGGAVFFDEYQHRLETVLSPGLKMSTMQPASNADLSFMRYPLEGLAFYRNDDLHFRVGGGAVMHMGNSLTGSGDLSNLDVQMKTALGGVVQADFVLDAWFVGMRYTALSYRVSGAEESAAANSLGVGLGYVYQFTGE
jgi:hypothetical protein